MVLITLCAASEGKKRQGCYGYERADRKMTSRTRIGSNGFARIGRMVFRAVKTRDDVEVVAVNDPLPIGYPAYLLKSDGVHGRFVGEIGTESGLLRTGGRIVAAFEEKVPVR